MAWKWYEVTEYKVSVGSDAGGYYGGVQLIGKGFYASLTSRKSGAVSPASAPVVAGEQRFYGSIDLQQHASIVDLLRNEKPVSFGWYEGDPNQFHLMTGNEPTGEEERIKAPA